MRTLTLLTTFLLSMTAFSGSGGFELYSCLSNSGRTSLTVRVSNDVDSINPLKVIFSIDGDQVVYEPEFAFYGSDFINICEGQPGCVYAEFNYEESRVQVWRGEETLLSVMIDGREGLISSDFADPRPGYDYPGSTDFDIELDCKHYHQEP